MTAYLSLINGKNSSTLKLVLFRDTGILGNQEHCSSPEVNKLRPTRAWLPTKSTDVYNTMYYNTCSNLHHTSIRTSFGFSVVRSVVGSEYWSKQRELRYVLLNTVGGVYSFSATTAAPVLQ